MSNDEDDLPDDFFNDLAEQEIFKEDTAESETKPEDDEQMERCLAEINKLQKDIARRKQKIKESEVGLSDVENKLRKPTHRRSRSRSRNRSDRREKSRSTRNDKRSRSKHRSPPNRRERSRRSRSNSPRSSSKKRDLSFLDELAETFAKKGQAFPERDLLMNQNFAGINSSIPQMIVSEPSNMGAMDFPNMMPFNQPFIQQPIPIDSVINFPHEQNFPIQPNLYYGGNQMNVLSGNPSNILPQVRYMQEYYS